jgi:molecular chaperone DnaJ
MSDYYSVLQLGRYATAAEIRAAFRRRAKETHPDTRSDIAEDWNDFIAVKHAYDVLSDPERRLAYDGACPPAAWVAADFPSEDDEFDWQSLRNAYRRSPPPAKPARAKKGLPRPRKEIPAEISKSAHNSDCQYVCHVTLEEAYDGARIKYAVRPDCDKCDGRGAQSVAGPACGACKGSGRARKKSFVVRMIFRDPCAACNGKGHVLTASACGECGGSGKFGTVAEYWTNLPPGIGNGAILRGPNDSLLTKISIWPHRTFERIGDDLMVTTYLEDASLKTGISITIHNIKGNKMKRTIPAGSEQGVEFRMPGWGMPRARGFSYGDLMVYIKPLSARPPEPGEAEE